MRQENKETDVSENDEVLDFLASENDNVNTSLLTVSLNNEEIQTTNEDLHATISLDKMKFSDSPSV
jgi:hypothetical protein